MSQPWSQREVRLALAGRVKQSVVKPVEEEVFGAHFAESGH